MKEHWIVLNVTHNMELAHRLYTLPGKCQNIHGHSMQVTLELVAPMDNNGYALGDDGTPLEFGAIKKTFRAYIDKLFDHHLHLNELDPWAKELSPRSLPPKFEPLPGLVAWPGDPSTENLAKWIFEAMNQQIRHNVCAVKIAETGTNGVEYRG